jgi:radical SAM superfamily enzyme YgiQ (UPF0313 family)
MNKSSNLLNILIVTGFSPIDLSRLSDLGISSEILPIIFKLFGKNKFHFSVPPIGPVAIASYVKQHLPEVEIKIQDYYERLNTTGYDIIGISATFMITEDIKELIKRIKKENQSALLVLGGPHDWATSPKMIFKNIPEIDFVIQQEGEETFTELIKTLSIDGNLNDVKGIAYLDRASNKVVVTQPRPPVNFEELPLPEWELMGIPSKKRLAVLPLETSRGCPYHCAYCSEVTYWGKPVRYRSNDRIIAEILNNVSKYKITTFRFTDSCFSATPERCASLCDAIYERCIKKKIYIKWSAYARIENLNPTLLKKMKRAGCVALDIGLESGSSKILRRMGKNFDPNIAVSIADSARETGIIINYNLVVGFPGEDNETLQASIDLIQRAAPNTYACFSFVLKPNTLIGNQMEKFGITGEGLSWEHASMSSKELNHALNTITAGINSAANFTGGEHFACYFSSLGYSTKDIVRVYKAIAGIRQKTPNIFTLFFLKQVAKKLAKYS